MDAEKYSRTISLNCPTCGSTQFSTNEGSVDDASMVACASCGLEISKEDLKTANSENIDEHLKEIQTQAEQDLQKEFKKSLQDAFRGSKFIKIK
jgi:transposase-like protein